MESGTQKLAEELAKLIKFIRICALMAILGTLCFFLYLSIDYALPTINKVPKEAKKSKPFDFMSLPGARLVEDNELPQETKSPKIKALREAGIKTYPIDETSKQTANSSRLENHVKTRRVQTPEGRIWKVPEHNVQAALNRGGKLVDELPQE